MKRMLIIAGLLLSYNTHAQITQVRRDTATTMPPPVYNQFQLPNYYQNNSMFSNNSMQTNPPSNPFAGPYTGNANYSDPSKSAPGPAPFNSANAGQPFPPVTTNPQK